jgi:hypothetical protein
MNTDKSKKSKKSKKSINIKYSKEDENVEKKIKSIEDNCKLINDSIKITGNIRKLLENFYIEKRRKPTYYELRDMFELKKS